MSAGMVQSEVAIIIDAPYAKVHIEQNDLLDHTIMRARQLASLLMSMQDDQNGPDHLLWLAQQIADELVFCVETRISSAGSA